MIGTPAMMELLPPVAGQRAAPHLDRAVELRAAARVLGLDGDADVAVVRDSALLDGFGAAWSASDVARHVQAEVERCGADAVSAVGRVGAIRPALRPLESPTPLSGSPPAAAAHHV
jgi:hypothetical protein